MATDFTGFPLILSDLKTGDRGIIKSIEPKEDNVSRLSGRGIVPGVNFCVLQFGDPLLILVDNEKWALSLKECSCIQVELTQTVGSFLKRIFRKNEKTHH